MSTGRYGWLHPFLFLQELLLRPQCHPSLAVQASTWRMGACDPRQSRSTHVLLRGEKNYYSHGDGLV